MFGIDDSNSNVSGIEVVIVGVFGWEGIDFFLLLQNVLPEKGPRKKRGKSGHGKGIMMFVMFIIFVDLIAGCPRSCKAAVVTECLPCVHDDSCQELRCAETCDKKS